MVAAARRGPSSTSSLRLVVVRGQLDLDLGRRAWGRPRSRRSASRISSSTGPVTSNVFCMVDLLLALGVAGQALAADVGRGATRLARAIARTSHALVETPSRSAAFSTAVFSDSGRRRLIRAESSSPTVPATRAGCRRRTRARAPGLRGGPRRGRRAAWTRARRRPARAGRAASAAGSSRAPRRGGARSGPTARRRGRRGPAGLPGCPRARWSDS